jgi:hypothetical protein
MLVKFYLSDKHYKLRSKMITETKYPIGCMVFFRYASDDLDAKRYGYVSFESLTSLDEDGFGETPSGIIDEMVAYYHDPKDSLGENFLDFVKDYASGKNQGSDLFIDNIVRFVFSRKDI